MHSVHVMPIGLDIRISPDIMPQGQSIAKKYKFGN